MAQKVAFFAPAMLLPNACEKRHFCAIYIPKRTFCQDRLGTNIGKTPKKMPFSAPGSAGRVWQMCLKSPKSESTALPSAAFASQFWLMTWSRRGVSVHHVPGDFPNVDAADRVELLPPARKRFLLLQRVPNV
jgi:hypothetical protein